MDNTALPSPSALNPNIGVAAHDVFDDFLWGGTSNDGPAYFTSYVKDGGVAIHETGAPVDNSYIGRLDVSTGTTSNNKGLAVYESSIGENRIKAGGAPLTIEWRIRIPVLSGTPEFNVKIGLQDQAQPAGLPPNGIFFNYSSTVNSGKWRGVTRNASTSTNVDSAITVVANTWYKLRFQINAAGTSVEFFVNDVSVGSSTSNISTTNAMRLMAGIEKQGTNSSISRTMNIDFVYYRIER